MYGLVIEDSLRVSAKEAMNRLQDKKVGSRPFFYPMHQQPVLRRLGLFEGEHYPVAEKLYKQGFYIPSGMAISEEQIQRVAATVLDQLN